MGNLCSGVVSASPNFFPKIYKTEQISTPSFFGILSFILMLLSCVANNVSGSSESEGKSWKVENSQDSGRCKGLYQTTRGQHIKVRIWGKQIHKIGNRGQEHKEGKDYLPSEITEHWAACKFS